MRVNPELTRIAASLAEAEGRPMNREERLESRKLAKQRRAQTQDFIREAYKRVESENFMEVA